MKRPDGRDHAGSTTVPEVSASKITIAERPKEKSEAVPPPVKPTEAPK